MALAACILGSSASFASTPAKKEVKEGNVLYNNGRFDEALKRYEDALLQSPDSDVVNFNLAAALYKTGDYEAALRHFEKSLVSEDEALEAAANYNLGNAEYKSGIAKENDALEEAIGLLKRSLAHYESAILLDPEDGDAKYNHEFVKKELERLQKKSEKEEKKKEEEKKDDKPESEEGKEEETPREKESEEKEEKKEEKEEEASQAEEKKDEGEGQEEESRKEEKEKPEEPEEKPEDKKPGEEEKGGEETRAGAAGYERPPGEMSEEEAERLLENYRREEEPKGLYREKLPASRSTEVFNDW